MPPHLEVRGLERRFGATRAVADCSFSLARGEVFALLGPSGCGKTTLLNLLAGFELPDAGEVLLDGVSIGDQPAHRRGIGVVFQSYALFPHMTVASNIAYGLKRLRGAERDARVAECVALLKLEGLEGRYPAALSGGQKQRVAVARALAPRPALLLLDEAFSALDRNLREATQVELSLLLRRLGITTILVTHDQREAFSLADRIAVMEGGRIVQQGPAREVYGQPVSAFVHGFLGTANTAPGRVAGGVARIEGGIAFPTPERRDGPIMARLRSEDVRLSPIPTPVHGDAPGTVALATFMGTAERYVVELAGQRWVVDAAADAPVLTLGQSVFLEFDPARCHITAEGA
ncbi:ABC transporter ATP-binding protein [Roseococcus suduntuyensis]|uniref:ABC-type Fe3+/spermidine/putrescine transport system ATPase subunit n=1 Tax=Roseococcus suduntuyensis TaxID=455361 RepID=A0A840A802_9PROT|nr:ABC transporter ATP-binding protein [Roseococcus suduntuyensis]MBB3898188.1 ABC-type Fe3+/spermidine/putrescine transport system ATPase subunit [Roseococcus suduntuyensis]